MHLTTKYKFLFFTLCMLFASGVATAQWIDCEEGDDAGCYGCGDDMDDGDEEGDSVSIDRIHAVDPNEISGPLGFDTARWVSVNDNLGYTVFFENDPDFATAPAQIVDIRLPIDPKLDIFSLRLGDFGFGFFSFQVSRKFNDLH